MAGRIKQPISHGVAKVPLVMQLEALECGAACLAMVLAYFGKWIPLEKVREDCGVSRDGSNAKSILHAARYYGLDAVGYRYETQALRSEGSFPCIIHWNFNHFVVLDGFRGNKAYLNDPAGGVYAVSMDVFDESFTGVCLQFEPTAEFTADGTQKSMLGFAAKRLSGAKTALLFAAVIGALTAVLNAVHPAFSRVLLDRLLSQKNPEWLMPFLIILAAFSILQILVSGVDAVNRLRISGKMAVIGNATYMWKVLKLPMAFFSQRMVGDIQARQESNAGIADTLINTLAPLVLNTVMVVVYLVVMLRCSVLLTVVGLLALVLNAGVSTLISRKRINISRVCLRDASKLYCSTVAGIEMIETIKAGGTESGYFEKWAGYQANVNTQKVRMMKTDHYLGIIPQFAAMLANDLILVLGIWLTMRGEFTVGMIMQFQSFLSLFMTPALTFVRAENTIQEMRTQMERVEDVMEYPEDDILSQTAKEDQPQSKLHGQIELRGVSFGYSPLAAPLIRDFDLTIRPGQSVAIVGSSGCGKSTVAKLISGLYRPWDGQILFDGKPHEQIDKNVFRSSVAVVDQDIVLFEDTIANNIKMWDESIEDFEMILAARDAKIHDEIMERPLGYQHVLCEDGADFSGGQRQRMEIARVLAQDPTVIILDEATSALDAKTEHEIVEAIHARGITCIVVAHRLSTIRSSDVIIVMQNGVITAHGTHEELMASCEQYRTLVTTE